MTDFEDALSDEDRDAADERADDDDDSGRGRGDDNASSADGDDSVDVGIAADDIDGPVDGAEDGEDRAKGRGRRYSQLNERGSCRFTREGVERIDYKDIVTLQKLLTAQGKILPRKRTGIAAGYQRMVRTAIKRARFMALMPYSG